MDKDIEDLIERCGNRVREGIKKMRDGEEMSDEEFEAMMAKSRQATEALIEEMRKEKKRG